MFTGVQKQAVKFMKIHPLISQINKTKTQEKKISKKKQTNKQTKNNMLNT